jgi:hypothetical protein
MQRWKASSGLGTRNGCISYKSFSDYDRPSGGFIPGEAVERCLACEADSVGTVGTVPCKLVEMSSGVASQAEFVAPLYAVSERMWLWNLNFSHDKQQTSRPASRLSPAYHGLASEAALYDWRPFGLVPRRRECRRSTVTSRFSRDRSRGKDDYRGDSARSLRIWFHHKSGFPCRNKADK